MSKTTSTPKKTKKKEEDSKETEKIKIFQLIRSIFLKYIPPLNILKDADTCFELISKKDIVFMGKKRDAMYFGAVMIHKGFVGLYLMHVYVKKDTVNELGPELRKALKGKSCFHITSIDNGTIAQIDKAISNGIKCYRKLNFI